MEEPLHSQSHPSFRESSFDPPSFSSLDSVTESEDLGRIHRITAPGPPYARSRDPVSPTVDLNDNYTEHRLVQEAFRDQSRLESAQRGALTSSPPSNSAQSFVRRRTATGEETVMAEGVAEQSFESTFSSSPPMPFGKYEKTPDKYPDRPISSAINNRNAERPDSSASIGTFSSRPSSAASVNSDVSRKPGRIPTLIDISNAPSVRRRESITSSAASDIGRMEDEISPAQKAVRENGKRRRQLADFGAGIGRKLGIGGSKDKVPTLERSTSEQLPRQADESVNWMDAGVSKTPAATWEEEKRRVRNVMANGKTKEEEEETASASASASSSAAAADPKSGRISVERRRLRRPGEGTPGGTTGARREAGSAASSTTSTQDKRNSTQSLRSVSSSATSSGRPSIPKPTTTHSRPCMDRPRPSSGSSLRDQAAAVPEGPVKPRFTLATANPYSPPAPGMHVRTYSETAAPKPVLHREPHRCRDHRRHGGGSNHSAEKQRVPMQDISPENGSRGAGPLGLSGRRSRGSGNDYYSKNPAGAADSGDTKAENQDKRDPLETLRKISRTSPSPSRSGASSFVSTTTPGGRRSTEDGFIMVNSKAAELGKLSDKEEDWEDVESKDKRAGVVKTTISSLEAKLAELTKLPSPPLSRRNSRDGQTEEKQQSGRKINRGRSFDSFLSRPSIITGLREKVATDPNLSAIPATPASATTSNRSGFASKLLRSPELSDYDDLLRLEQQADEDDRSRRFRGSSNSPLSTRGARKSDNDTRPAQLKGKTKQMLEDDDSDMDTLDLLIANDRDFASLLHPAEDEEDDTIALLSGNGQKYNPPSSSKQNVRPRGEVAEADRQREREIAVQDKLMNRLKTLQLEVRAARKGIDVLEKRLHGPGTSDDSSEVLDEEDLRILERVAREETRQRARIETRAAAEVADRPATWWYTILKWGSVMVLIALVWFSLEFAIYLQALSPSYSKYPAEYRAPPQFGSQITLKIANGVSTIFDNLAWASREFVFWFLRFWWKCLVDFVKSTMGGGGGAGAEGNAGQLVQGMSDATATAAPVEEAVLGSDQIVW